LYLWTRLRMRYLVWSYIWWFIGTLPDRPRYYTVWSTLEPLKEDLHTWAGVIQVGSTTGSMRDVRATHSWLRLGLGAAGSGGAREQDLRRWRGRDSGEPRRGGRRWVGRWASGGHGKWVQRLRPGGGWPGGGVGVEVELGLGNGMRQRSGARKQGPGTLLLATARRREEWDTGFDRAAVAVSLACCQAVAGYLARRGSQAWAGGAVSGRGCGDGSGGRRPVKQGGLGLRGGQALLATWLRCPAMVGRETWREIEKRERGEREKRGWFEFDFSPKFVCQLKKFWIQKLCTI
jgi:hypothetical protein